MDAAKDVYHANNNDGRKEPYSAPELFLGLVHEVVYDFRATATAPILFFVEAFNKLQTLHDYKARSNVAVRPGLRSVVARQ